MRTSRLPSRIYRVDLSSETVTSEVVPDRWIRHYLGGKGLGARYLYAELDAGTDPCGPENRLCLMRGPFSGQLPGETRYVAITKSPLTGLFVDSYSGGSFADAFVGALADHLGLVIEGRAAEPVVLSLEDGQPSVHKADELWGLDIAALDDAVDAPVAGIGPAGEHEVAFATIATDGGDHHAGRGGTGAVMGSKRLKAIIANGDPPNDPAIESASAAYLDRFEADHRGRWHEASGTVETLDAADVAGVLPTRGWRDGSFEGAAGIGVEAMRRVAASREAVDADIPGDFDIDGVMARGGLGIALGANLGIDDVDDVVELGRICDTLGVDIIEAGNAVAWTILASEAGILDSEMAFGDPSAAASLIEDIATRETPVAATLADGLDRATTAFGGDDLVPTVKSMSAATYDARPVPSMALSFATSDRGACHRRARPVFDELFDADGWDDADRVDAVIEEQNRRSVLWCLIVDDITAPAFEEDLGASLFAAIDVDMDTETLATIGERVWTLTRLFNIREGTTAAEDSLPAAFQQPLGDGPRAGASIDPAAFESLLDRYYRERRWGPEGRPTQSLVADMGLETVLDTATPLAEKPTQDT